MQSTTTKFIILLAIIVNSSHFAHAAVWHQSSIDSNNQLVIQSAENSRETIVEFNLAKVAAEATQIDGQTYMAIELDGATYTKEKGLPQLPVFFRNLAITPDANWQIEVLGKESKIITAAPPTPSKGTIYRNQSPAAIPLYAAPSFYQSQRRYPEANYDLGKRFVFRDMHGAQLKISPLVYDAAAKNYQLITHLKLKISFDKAKNTIAMLEAAPKIVSFRELYTKSFAGLSQQTLTSLGENVGEEGRMLIIAHKDLLAGLSKFTQWKRQLGFQVEIVNLDLVGSKVTEIKSYIKSYYNYHKNLAFVLLVGDAEQIPYHRATAGPSKGEEADPMYGLLTGNDSYPEVIVARFPANNLNELDRMISRGISYEREPLQSDYYSRAIGIASDEGSPSDGKRADKLRTELLNAMFSEVDRVYDPQASTSEISRALNEGRGLVNYIGHGDTTSWVTGDFSNGDINRLTNSNRLPAIVSVACLNGNFGTSSGDSFAETWIKSGTTAKPRGAVAVFASSTNQAWVPPTVGQRAIVDMIAAERYLTVGALFINGSIAVLNDGDSDAEETFQTWHIFGDPTLRLRTREPTLLPHLAMDNQPSSSQLRHQLNIGQADLNVTLMDGKKQLARGRSLANGDVQFFDWPDKFVTDDIYLTISGQQLVPKEVRLELRD